MSEVAIVSTKRAGLRPLGIAIAALGAVTAIVPISVYNAYEAMPHMVMKCLVTSYAEIAVGAAIAVLGVLYFLFQNARRRLIVSAAVAVLAALSLLFPTNFTGLCESEMMACRMITFPVLLVSAILIFAASGVGIVFARRALGQA